MARLTIVDGIILETQRYINLPMRFGERYLARERREVWLRGSDRRESKWIIHTRQLPARRGHRVALLLRKHWVVGMLNASTGAEVNYVRADPPFLLRGVDLLVIVATLILLPSFLGEAGLVAAVLTIVAYLLAVTAARAVRRWWLRARVDAAIRLLRLSWPTREWS
ncbi:MAG TPA: hypothetical protein VLW55_18170 [Burkholderiaceae bacterium]|nr:hypothetical protein [Burkholderiaceae bacterium]